MASTEGKSASAEDPAARIQEYQETIRAMEERARRCPRTGLFNDTYFDIFLQKNN